MPLTLHGADKTTYETLFRHPVARNLEWHRLTALFRHMGELEEGGDGALKFRRNGQTLALHARDKDVDIEQLMRVRRFLENSEGPSVEEALVEKTGLEETQLDDPLESGPGLVEVRESIDVVVLLEHSGARIFRLDETNATPDHVVPDDPLGHDQQVHNPKGDSGGKQGPLRKLFYEALVRHLDGADRILLVGDGQGASSEAHRFLEDIQKHHHHREFLAKIAGNEIANISHLTDPEIRALGRDFLGALDQSK